MIKSIQEISALKEAEALLERHKYYVKPETLKAYHELTHFVRSNDKCKYQPLKIDICTLSVDS